MIGLTGGKTGGHIIPLVAISKKEENVVYVGGSGFLEEEICKKHNINFIGLKIKSKKIINLLKAYRKIKIDNLDAILSTGGFVSIPLLIYGVIHRIPIFLLEENTIIGLSNKFFSLFAKKIFLSYPIKKNNSKYVVVGQPLLINNISFIKYSKYKCDVLILGGSLGSKPLCDLALKLSDKYSVCLVAGRYADEYKSDKYTTFPYIDDLLNLMLQARMIISRAGAQTIAEIFYINKPCILVPSMKTKKNHQYLNAIYFQDKNCCKVVVEDKINKINDEIDLILGNQNIVNIMKKNQKKMINLDSCDLIMKEIYKEIRK